jgi:hypothetical protein
LVSRDGLDEWQGKSKSREQILSIKKLPTMIEDSSLLTSVPDSKMRRGVEGFSYFSYIIQINGIEYEAILTVKRTKEGGDKYYHHYLKDIKIEPRSGNWHPPVNTE